MLYNQKKEELEDLIFQTIEGLYQAKYMKDIDKYRLGLDVLDNFLQDYYHLTGTNCLDSNRVLELHSKQWELICNG